MVKKTYMTWTLCRHNIHRLHLPVLWLLCSRACVYIMLSFQSVVAVDLSTVADKLVGWVPRLLSILNKKETNMHLNVLQPKLLQLQVPFFLSSLSLSSSQKTNWTSFSFFLSSSGQIAVKTCLLSTHANMALFLLLLFSVVSFCHSSKSFQNWCGNNLICLHKCWFHWSIMWDMAPFWTKM